MEHIGQTACVSRVAKENRRDSPVGWAAFEAGLFATAYESQSALTVQLIDQSARPQMIDESRDQEEVLRHDYQQSRDAVGLTNWQIVAQLSLPSSQRHAVADILSQR